MGATIENLTTGKQASLDDFISAMKFNRKWNKGVYERVKRGSTGKDHKMPRKK
jgi:hypothetical protein